MVFVLDLRIDILDLTRHLPILILLPHLFLPLLTKSGIQGHGFPHKGKYGNQYRKDEIGCQLVPDCQLRVGGILFMEEGSCICKGPAFFD